MALFALLVIGYIILVLVGAGFATEPTSEKIPPLNTTLACPKLETFNIKVQGDKDFSRNCRVVAAKVGGFEIKLCESMRECGQGYFLIKRLDKAHCDKAMARSISWDYEFDAWMKKEIGPDAFVITFSGPQRAAPSDWRHLGNCVYKHPYRLTNTGNYTVSIVHANDNFEAIQEKDRTWLRSVNNNLLTDWNLDVCSIHCKTFTSDMIGQMALPVCGRWHPTQGVYLHSVEEHMLTQERYRVENYQIPYFWYSYPISHPLACKYDQLFELGSNNDCHAKNHSIKFLGDSQVRVSWDVTDRRLAGTRDPLLNNVHEGSRQNYYFEDGALNRYWEEDKEKPVSPEPSKHRTMIDFAGRDGHLTWFTTEYAGNPEFWRLGDATVQFPETNNVDRRLREFNSVLFNVGMWPMSGIRDGGHFTANRYKAMLTWAAENMMEANRRRASMNVEPLTFVWHGISSFPVTKPQEITYDSKLRKDWRNPYRLKIWSDLAEQVLTSTPQLETSIRRINTFELTHPFIHDTPDGGHFFRTPAVEAETDEILHKLNICEKPN
ncbi:hypothetical protein CcCBS67573_g00230 [Chytriomyces confervae]|uniref:Uncharacterized protein n=1 Tax=Chytriomyces confervae TaxID=246404 RepID=A0A507FTX3_9FUNG|nr:hypothetical protein CcCBS67573_g00230 [Chytriomyces confervae]